MTVALGLVATAPSSAQAEADESRSITYAPRDGVLKKMRTMTESRSYADDRPAVAVLAPNEAGGTALAQPTLYWFASKPISSKVALSIIDEESSTTVFETVMDGPTKGGILSIQLGKLQVSLRPNRDYRWSVSVLGDPEQRSAELFASGVVRRADMAPDLATQLNRIPTREMPFFLAKHGLWYDALAVLSGQIARHPNDRGLRTLRANLLEQIGLYEVAKFDRQ